jgi:hypothetical protein
MTGLARAARHCFLARAGGDRRDPGGRPSRQPCRTVYEFKAGSLMVVLTGVVLAALRYWPPW